MGPTRAPTTILGKAIRAVPAVKYALGVAGVIAVIAIVVGGWKIDERVAVFGFIVMIVLMTILAVFAKIPTTAIALGAPLLVVVWSAVILFVATAGALFFSVFFDWPVPLKTRVFPKDEKSSVSLPAQPQGAVQSPTQVTAPQPASARCYRVGNVTWCKNYGGVQSKDSTIVLHDDTQKTEVKATQLSDNLDCTFELQFDQGKSDSSIGLEIWRDKEYSITFRGGAVKVVAAGESKKEETVQRYAGRRIGIHLRVSDKHLLADIDGHTYVNQRNSYWQAIGLQPRLNADQGDTITLYSSNYSSN